MWVRMIVHGMCVEINVSSICHRNAKERCCSRHREYTDENTHELNLAKKTHGNQKIKMMISKRQQSVMSAMRTMVASLEHFR